MRSKINTHGKESRSSVGISIALGTAVGVALRARQLTIWGWGLHWGSLLAQPLMREERPKRKTALTNNR